MKKRPVAWHVGSTATTVDDMAVTLALVITIWLQSLAHTAGETANYFFGPREEFDFVDLEEFMILERLGGMLLGDSRIAGFVAAALPIVPGA